MANEKYIKLEQLSDRILPKIKQYVDANAGGNTNISASDDATSVTSEDKNDSLNKVTITNAANATTVAISSNGSAGLYTTSSILPTKDYVDTGINSKQDTLTAGEGIDITNDTISADTTVLATKAELSDYATSQELTDGLAAKQNTLTAGDNIQITNDTISATDTTYEEATDSEAGLIKTDSSKSISLNADGQLEVGGRLGQFEGTTGLFAPDNRDPRMVGNYDLLITDVKGISMTNSRAFALVSGYGQTCKSAPAGTTEYHVTNNYANRIMCKILENGFAAKDEASSTVETIPVVSVTIDGQPYEPDSAPDDSTKDIVITTERTLNPDSETTTIRAVGTIGAYSSAHIGNGIASENGGRHLLLGAAITKTGSSNDDCVVGQGHYVSGNGNAAFGRYHIIRKNRGFYAGTGHDGTNARGEGVSALGQYSLLDGNTLFAVGNGTSHTNRLNAFEVNVKNGGTAKVNFIEANNGKLEFASTQDLAPSVSIANWGFGTGGSIEDFDGTLGFATTDVRGTAVNITAATGAVKPVTAGETLQWSFKARKKTGDETGKLQLNLLKCNASGGSTSNNVVHDGTAASYTTEWVTYSGSFTVPDGMEYVRPRFSRTNTGAGSAGGYEIKDFTLIQSVDSGIVLTSPNGTRYKISVDDSGNLSTTAV